MILQSVLLGCIVGIVCSGLAAGEHTGLRGDTIRVVPDMTEGIIHTVSKPGLRIELTNELSQQSVHARTTNNQSTELQISPELLLRFLIQYGTVFGLASIGIGCYLSACLSCKHISRARSR